MPSGALLGRIHPMRDKTGPEDRPWEETVEGLAWDELGRITFAGTREATLMHAKWAGVASQNVQDVGNALVFPGFVDAHMHFLSVGLKRTRPSLHEVASLDDCLRQVSAWLESHPGQEPIVGEGWDESGWPDGKRPSRADLDRVAAEAGQPDRPIVLRRVCGHIAVASTPALPDIQARWTNPELVDPATGILLEAPSLYLNEVFPATWEQLRGAVDHACDEALRLGVTTVGDYSQAPYRTALLEAANEGRLRVRVASSIYVQQLEDELARGFRTGKEPEPGQAMGKEESGGAAGKVEQRSGKGGFLRDGGLKVFLDGSLGARTAALRAPYLDPAPGTPTSCPDRKSRFGCVGHPHVRGTLNWSDEEVGQLVRKAATAGVQVHAHAIGDAAIDQALAWLSRVGGSVAGAGEWTAAREGVRRPGPGEGLRHRIEHFEIVHDEQRRATAQAGIVASCQPNFVGTWSAKGGMYEARLGDRYRLGNRFRSYLDAGIEVAFGSDGMPFGPLQGIRAATQHPDPGQSLQPMEAVWHYTNRSAWSLHWEDAVGSLEVGKEADMVVIEGRDVEQWIIHQTILAGERGLT